MNWKRISLAVFAVSPDAKAGERGRVAKQIAASLLVSVQQPRTRAVSSGGLMVEKSDEGDGVRYDLYIHVGQL